MKITSKRDMYRRLARGAFGNTIPQYFSVESWIDSCDAYRYPSWGVRSATIAGHPACKLFLPRQEVADYAKQHFADGVNISMMVDAVARVTSMLHVAEIDGQGLIVDGVLEPKQGANWRVEMASNRRRQFDGVTAKLILERYLNPNSLEDLCDVLETFPGAVVELSTVEQCIGTIANRNAVVWEVRHY